MSEATFKYGVRPPAPSKEIEQLERELDALGPRPAMTLVYAIEPPKYSLPPVLRPRPAPLPALPGIPVDGAMLYAKLEELRLYVQELQVEVRAIAASLERKKRRGRRG